MTRARHTTSTPTLSIYRQRAHDRSSHEMQTRTVTIDVWKHTGRWRCVSPNVYDKRTFSSSAPVVWRLGAYRICCTQRKEPVKWRHAFPRRASKMHKHKSSDGQRWRRVEPYALACGIRASSERNCGFYPPIACLRRELSRSRAHSVLYGCMRGNLSFYPHLRGTDDKAENV